MKLYSSERLLIHMTDPQLSGRYSTSHGLFFLKFLGSRTSVVLLSNFGKEKSQIRLTWKDFRHWNGNWVWVLWKRSTLTGNIYFSGEQMTHVHVRNGTITLMQEWSLSLQLQELLNSTCIVDLVHYTRQNIPESSVAFRRRHAAHEFGCGQFSIVRCKEVCKG